MKKIRHITLLAVLLLSGASQAFAAQAGPDNARRAPVIMPEVRVLQVQPVRVQSSRVQYAQQRISAAQAKAAARRHVPGAQVVGISLEGSSYRVRMVRSDGRRVDVFVDAVTGRVR